MKKCPKCGANNRPDSTSCFNCFESLEGVPNTESAAPQAPPRPPMAPRQAQQPQNRPLGGPSGAGQPPVAGPNSAMGVPLGADGYEGPVSVVGQPLGAPGPQHGANTPPPSPYGPPAMRTGGPRRVLGEGTKKPFNFGAMITTILTLAVVFGAGGFIIYRFMLIPNATKEPVRQFINAMQKNDAAGVKKVLSKNSQWLVDPRWLNKVGTVGTSLNTFGTQPAGSYVQPFEEEKQWVLEFVSLDGNGAWVLVKPGPVPANTFTPDNMMTLSAAFAHGESFHVVKEGTEWKVDLLPTLRDRWGELFAQLAAKKGIKNIEPTPTPKD